MAATLAALHYLALAIGFSSLILRGIRMDEAFNGASLAKVFTADNFWGISAALWLVTGAARAFAGYEKGSEYYLHNHWFWLKMGLFTLVFTLEIWPMTTLIKWRMARKHVLNGPFERGLIQRFQLLNRIQVVLIFLIPIAAVLMARGL